MKPILLGLLLAAHATTYGQAVKKSISPAPAATPVPVRGQLIPNMQVDDSAPIRRADEIPTITSSEIKGESTAAVEAVVTVENPKPTVAGPAQLVHYSITAIPVKGAVSFFTRTAAPAMVSYRITDAATGAEVAQWRSDEAREQQFVNLPEENFRIGKFEWQVLDANGALLSTIRFTAEDCKPVVQKRLARP